MEITFGEKYWILIVFISLVMATGITLLLYYKNIDNKELAKYQLRILMASRFVSVFFITMILSGPLIKTIKKISQLPKVILAIDNSSSITGLNVDIAQKSAISIIIKELQNELKAEFEVVTYTFGDKVQLNQNLEFNEKISDYGFALQTIYDNHFNENIGAFILIGDGIYNQGANPLNTVQKFNLPVYTLGLGDTTSIKDARIAEIRVNRTAFSGNKFPVETDIKVTGMKNQNLLFSIQTKGEKIYSENIQITSNDFFKTIQLSPDATGKGIQYYSASIETLAGEQNRRNNSQQFVINVLENKQKILILSNGPHPDAGAIKNALEEQINYDVTLITSEPFPTDLKGFNLVLLNQIPSSSQSGKQIIDQTILNRIPLLVIVGNQTFLPQLNLLGLGIEILPQAGEFEEAQPILNEQYSAFTTSNNLKENLSRYPPLKVPFARYNLDPGYQYIAYQRIKNIVTTRPLIVTGNRDNRKIGFIFGEGIWRWRLYNYTLSNHHNEFNELIDKLVQYLANRDNQDNFIIDFKTVYQETENITLSAEVYNDAFELITTPEVTITLKDSLLHEFRYTFDRSGQFYRLNTGLFPPGNYSFEAQTTIGANTYTERGNFAIMAVNIEQIETKANHKMLFQLAFQSGGQFFTASESKLLVRSVLDNSKIKTITYFQTMLNEILNLRWLFFVILLVLALEWFLRKFWGIY